MCMKLLKYRDNEQVYTTADRIIFPPFTNGWTLKNNGNTNVVLNNAETLPPGASKSIGGNYGEIYDGRLDIRFTMPTPAPVTPLNKAVLTFKYYTGAIPFPNEKV